MEKSNEIKYNNYKNYNNKIKEFNKENSIEIKNQKMKVVLIQ